MNGSLPGSSVYGIFQPRIWEGVAIPSSMGSSRLIEPGSPTLQILCHLCHQQIIFMHKYIEYVCTYMCLHTQITNMYAQSVCNVYTPSVYICVCTQIQAYTCIHIHTHNICIYTWIVYIVSVCIHTHTHTHTPWYPWRQSSPVGTWILQNHYQLHFCLQKPSPTLRFFSIRSGTRSRNTD